MVNADQGRPAAGIFERFVGEAFHLLGAGHFGEAPAAGLLHRAGEDEVAFQELTERKVSGRKLKERVAQDDEAGRTRIHPFQTFEQRVAGAEVLVDGHAGDVLDAAEGLMEETRQAGFGVSQSNDDAGDADLAEILEEPMDGGPAVDGDHGRGGASENGAQGGGCRAGGQDHGGFCSARNG